MEHWSIGALEHWSIGALEHWSIGALAHWRISEHPLLNTPTRHHFIDSTAQGPIDTLATPCAG